MSKKIVLDLPEPFLDAEQKHAADHGLPLSEWLVQKLVGQPSPSSERGTKASLLALCGTVSHGGSNSADNDGIDADLAREYGRGL